MANTKSAKKAIRVAERKSINNKMRDQKVQDALDAVKKLIEKGATKKESMEAMSKLQKSLDKAVKSDSLHKNTAARMKSKANKNLKKVTK